MKVLDSRFAGKLMAAVLAVVLGFSLGPAAQSQQQPAPAHPQAQPAQPADTQTTPQPAQSGAVDSGGQQNGAASPGTSPGVLPDAPQSNPPAQQPDNASPLGTAAAPAEKVTGVAASRPAGAAIAPGKQRRVHSLVIKTGLVIGAAVAVGAVAALSRSSSSHPH